MDRQIPTFVRASGLLISPCSGWFKERTGEVMQVPLGIGPGFGYNPGRVDRGEQLAKLLAEKR